MITEIVISRMPFLLMACGFFICIIGVFSIADIGLHVYDNADNFVIFIKGFMFSILGVIFLLLGFYTRLSNAKK